MKKKAILLISLALSLFLTSFSLADGTMASEPTLRITIDPRTGPPGTAISVTGEGAQADKLVRVAFVTSGEGGISLAEVEVTPQADGTFTAIIIVPDGTGGGTYAVRAEQTNPSTGSLIHYWYTSFNVTGAVAVTPEGPAPAEPTAAGATPAAPEGTAPLVPTTATAEPAPSVMGTVTATVAAPPAGMPITGQKSSEPNNTTLIVIAILATFGVLVAFGAGLRQARKS